MVTAVIPGVSVLIRAHLSSPYLYEALSSVSSQENIGQIEILMCLDRPTDELIAQIDLFRREFPHFELHLVDAGSAGIARRLNIMILCAKYELIAILDSDDRMLPNRLSLQLRYLMQNPEIAVVGSAINIIDENGKFIGQKGFTTEPITIARERWKNLPVAHPSVMMRKSIVTEVGGYRDFYFPSEDYDLWLRILEVSSIANLSDVLTDYRIHFNQTTSSRIFRNVSGGVSSRISARRRMKNKSELHTKYSSSVKWAVTSLFLPIVLRLAMRAYAWNRLADSAMLLKMFWLALFLLVSPYRGLIEIKRKIRQKIKY